MKKKLWMSWSTGKDSALALHELRSNSEFEVVGLLTTVTEEYQRVSMHAVREQLLQHQADVLGLPLHQIKIPAQCSNQEYESRMSLAMNQALAAGVSHMGFGDLFLEEVRAYRVKKLAGTGIEPVFPLWQRPTAALAREMLACGIKAVLTCIDPKVLDESFAGRVFDESLLEELPTHVDPCGENGEFHSFVHDGPMFKKPIGIRIGERIHRDGFVFADVHKL